MIGAQLGYEMCMYRGKYIQYLGIVGMEYGRVHMHAKLTEAGHGSVMLICKFQA